MYEKITSQLHIILVIKFYTFLTLNFPALLISCMAPDFWWLNAFCCSLLKMVWVVCLWRSKYLQQLKLKRMICFHIFSGGSPNKIILKFKRKRTVVCHLSCQRKLSRTQTVWPKTAGMRVCFSPQLKTTIFPLSPIISLSFRHQKLLV